MRRALLLALLLSLSLVHPRSETWCQGEGRGEGAVERGKQIVLGRDSNCLLCHVVPDAGGRAMGNLGPSLAGTGARHTPEELRLRIVDSLRLNPESIMPSYHRVDGLERVGDEWRGKPVLSAQQVEDVVAYLRTLR